MNDAEAMDAIAEVLERFYRGNLPAYETILEIARIKGENEMRRLQ